MSIPTKILIDWSLQRLAARVRGRTALRPALPRASEPLRQRRHSSARSSWGLHRRWNRSWPRLTRLIAWKTWRVGKCWNMLKPSAKIFSCAHTHRHRHEHRHRHRNTHTHTHAHSIFVYIYIYVYVYICIYLCIYIHIYMIIYVYNCVWYIKLRNAASLRCKWSELSLSRLLQLRAALRMDSWRHDPSTERTCGHVAWNGVYSQSEGRPLCRSRQHPWCLTKNNAGFCEIILMNLNPTILFITWAILSCVACRGFSAGTRKLSWRDAENFKASFQYFNLSCPSSPSPEHWSSWFTAVPRSIVVSRVGEVTVRSPTFHQCWRGSSNEKQSPGCRIVNIRRYIQYQGICCIGGRSDTFSLSGLVE